MPSVLSRRRTIALAAAFAVIAAATAVLASTLAPSMAGARPSPTVALRSTGLGRILVTGSGRTLYAFAHDGRNRDRCVSISGCTGVWPTLTVRGGPHAGAGVRGSLLSTIRLSNGRHQVTYAGHPLYSYVADSGPGQTSYVGVSQFGGTWLALRASGATVR
jgi:predicted lipoprotein with Yx(FWY)xxD motif